MKRTFLAILASLSMVAACGDADPGTGSDEVKEAVGNDHKFVASALIVPSQTGEFAMDLNGDNKADNALGRIIGALIAQGFKVQEGIDEAVNKGSALILMNVKSTDDTLKSADKVGVAVNLAQSKDMPDFTGKGSFSVDTSQATAQFYGKITSGKFSSNSPVTTKAPVSVTINLPLIPGSPPVKLALNGAHLLFKSSGCAANPTTGKTPTQCGELHGSIKKDDLDKTVIPAIATLLTKQITDNPGSDSAKQVKQLFDVGDGKGAACTDPDGKKGEPNDNLISICEVSGNPLIANILVPDIQVFDAAGAYAPNPATKPPKPDSLSLGIGFEAVGATY